MNENQSHKTIEEQIKDYLKENLEITIEESRTYDGKKIEVSLRFVGDDFPFTKSDYYP